MTENIREKLFELRDPKYKQFQQSLIPNCNNTLGIRIPQLRNIAKDITKGDWKSFLLNEPEDYFEEVMIKGMVIGYVKENIDEKLELIEWFIPKITNWSICDSFCVGLKCTKKDRKKVWDFLIPYLNSENEYEVRFSVVMLLIYYVETEYIEMVLRLLNSVKHEGYYVKMAVAWAISICYIHFPEKSVKLLKDNELDDFTYNKALQKIIESNRIDKSTKELMRNMKRKIKK